MLDLPNVNMTYLEFNLQLFKKGNGGGGETNFDKSLLDQFLGCLNWKESKSKVSGTVCTVPIPATQDINMAKISPMFTQHFHAWYHFSRMSGFER